MFLAGAVYLVEADALRLPCLVGLTCSNGAMFPAQESVGGAGGSALWEAALWLPCCQPGPRSEYKPDQAPSPQLPLGSGLSALLFPGNPAGHGLPGGPGAPRGSLAFPGLHGVEFEEIGEDLTAAV